MATTYLIALYLDLEPEDTKNSEPRRMYFNDVLLDIFKRAGKVRNLKHGFVFTYRGKPIKDFREGFNKALERAGIENFHPHDLRHTFNTNMRKARVDQTVIMKLTGHKTLAMFTRYNTVDQADAKDAMEKLESYFGKAEEPTAAIVLQAQKRGQEQSPNPLN
ncbi:MAG: site-specific integrase [Thermodesulfobacteriota bacterium]